ncbi:MAG: gephyrin-like molybdotransferase Glp [Terriglobales bacterium]
MPEVILSFEQARRAVEREALTARPSRTETVPLSLGNERILAEAITADRDLPPFPRSTRDGYAVRSADRGSLKVVAEIRAGITGELPTIKEGECAAIMTGAPVPPGADAVIMIEHTSLAGSTVNLQREVKPGENIVLQGAEAKRGDVLLQKGTRLTPAALAVAASAGKSELKVFARPKIAILSTGDELVEVAQQPAPTQIRNSNSYSLAAQITEAGGDPVILPIAPDETNRLRELIEEGLRSDLLLLSGGVSMGKHDLVEPVLKELKADFFFTGAKIQPGKPVVFGRAREKYVFALPGNPVSTLVTFQLFAKPLVEALAGAAPQPLRFLQARLRSDISVKPGLTRFLPAIISGEFDRTEVELVKWQGSGDVVSAAKADCYIVIPETSSGFPKSSNVNVLLM